MAEGRRGDGDGMRAPIFVVGLNKSGTSLLYLVLSNHSALSGVAAAVTSKTGSATLYLGNHGLTEGHKLAGLPATLRPKPSVHLFGAPRFIDEHRQLGPAPDEERIRTAEAFSAAMADPGKRLVEKSPPNMVRTRYLQSMFPDATFIAITRDPYANVAANSVKRTKWGSVTDQAAHWAGAHGAFLQDRPHLASCLTVRYEDLIADPDKTLSAVCSAAGLEYEPTMLNGVEISRNINADLIGSLDWQSRRQIAKVIPAATMAAFGYKKPSLGGPFAWLRRPNAA